MNKIAIILAAVIVLSTYFIDWPMYSFLAIFAMIIIFISLSNIFTPIGGWR